MIQPSFTSIAQTAMIILGPLVTYILTRGKFKAEARKIVAEAEKVEIDGTAAMFKMWKETVEELRIQVKTLSNEVHRLENRVSVLTQELIKAGINPPADLQHERQSQQTY